MPGQGFHQLRSIHMPKAPGLLSVQKSTVTPLWLHDHLHPIQSAREEVPCVHMVGGVCVRRAKCKTVMEGRNALPTQALQDRPTPPHDQGVPMSLDTKRKTKKIIFFLSIPNHGFLCLKLQVLLNYEYVNIKNTLVFTVPAYMGNLHGFSQCF